MKNTDFKYKIGLALSGGGAKGFAHAGVIRALEERGIRPDVIAGTSAGSIVGALYADGNTPDEIIDFFNKASFSKFASLAKMNSGLFKIDHFKKALKTKLKAVNFEDLKIPTYINATDMEHGKNVFFNSGPLLDVVIASCSVPILFEPVKMDGIFYSDGGLICNFPVEVLRRQCEYVIGVNVGPLDIGEKEKLTFLDMAQRTYFFLRKANVLNVKDQCDILIEPPSIDRYGMFDAEKNHEIFMLGYEEAVRVLDGKEDWMRSLKKNK
ncbi:MAG: patatin-like phospholipase family protein [Bacteroidales bacterium]|nr:patatin-like phospholipase family protein [Bacteroidales bacterium]